MAEKLGGSGMIRPERYISPGHLALCGMLSLPAFLFGDSLRTKLVLTGLYLLCTLLTGKRIKVFPNLAAALGIVGANLITPFGKVYFRLGNFPVTEGALQLGLLKAATIIGLIYLSRLTIRATIRLPGKVGEVFALMLYYFEGITEQKMRLDRKNLWKSLDELLHGVYETAAPEKTDSPVFLKTRMPGFALCLGFLLLNWGIFLSGLLVS